MEPRTIGSLFWYLYDYGHTGTRAPLFNWHGTTREVDPPYRYGACLILRLPLTSRALALGRWLGRLDSEDEAIYLAMGGRPVGVSSEEIREWD